MWRWLSVSRFVRLSLPDLSECLARSLASLAVGSWVWLARRFRLVLPCLASCLVCPLWVCRPCKGRIKLPSLPRCMWLPCCHFGASASPHSIRTPCRLALLLGGASDSLAPRLPALLPSQRLAVWAFPRWVRSSVYYITTTL